MKQMSPDLATLLAFLLETVDRLDKKTWEDFNHSTVLKPLTSPEEGTKRGALSGEHFQNPGETKSRKVELS